MSSLFFFRSWAIWTFAFIVADFATAVARVTLNENHLYHMQIHADATEQRVSCISTWICCGSKCSRGNTNGSGDDNEENVGGDGALVVVMVLRGW